MICLAVMIFASFFNVLLLLGVLRSNRYKEVVESISDSMFKELYGIGFVVADLKVVFIKDRIIERLKTKTTLLYGKKYAEYYAQCAFAKALTFTVILFGILPAIGVVMGTGGAVFMMIIALFGTVVAWNFSVISILDETKKREEICIAEFPDMVTKFALLINSGMVLREAWNVVAQSKENILYELMRESCEEMKNGKSDIDAIYEFGIKTNSTEIRKFTASMIQGISKGNSELSAFLTEQAQELLSHKKQILLQKGEKAAGKLLIPIGITFVGIILIIGVGAMQAMSF